MSSTGYTSESTRTYTVKDGSGTKTITERTVTKADGSTVTYREEKTENGGCSGDMSGEFEKMKLKAGFGDMEERRRQFFSDKLGDGKRSPRIQDGQPKQGGASPAGKTSESSQGVGSLSEFREEALKAHNERRKKHGVPPLKLSSDLNDYAQKWADHLVKTGKFQHSDCQMGSERLGENIANKWSSAGADYTGEEVTQQWYSEISKHDYKSEQSMGTGHFTQVVWKDSQELGIGKSKSSDGKVIVVASYRPPGNFVGNFTKNVFPPK